MIPRKLFFIYIGISFLLIFFAWQGVTIFTLGYRVDDVSEKVRQEEIRRQQLLKRYGSVAGMYEIDRRASGELGMIVPGEQNIMVKVLKKEKLYLSQSDRRIPVISYIKEVFLTSTAEAGQ